MCWQQAAVAMSAANSRNNLINEAAYRLTQQVLYASFLQNGAVA